MQVIWLPNLPTCSGSTDAGAPPGAWPGGIELRCAARMGAEIKVLISFYFYRIS
jgi:hypothetical protein